jgi:hypothetical protein
MTPTRNLDVKAIWAYGFAHRTGPGHTGIPAYLGAGHAAELAYLLRHNGAPIASTFDADGRRPARHVAVLEFVCRLHGNPAVGLLPRFNRAVMCCAGG